MLRNVVFIALALASLTAWVRAPVALVAGVAFALLWGTPFTSKLEVAQTALLQASVVGLGAAMNLERVLRVGAAGFVETAFTLASVFAIGALLSRVLRTERTASLLVTVGTAICGGSAIAAVAPAIGAKRSKRRSRSRSSFCSTPCRSWCFPRWDAGSRSIRSRLASGARSPFTTLLRSSARRCNSAPRRSRSRRPSSSPAPCGSSR